MEKDRLRYINKRFKYGNLRLFKNFIDTHANLLRN